MAENQKDKKDGTVEEDQKDRGYYYDDAHGYEEFDPEEEDDAEIERRGDAGERDTGTRDAGSERRGDAGERDTGTRDAGSERRGDAAMSSLKLPTDDA